MVIVIIFLVVIVVLSRSVLIGRVLCIISLCDKWSFQAGAPNHFEIYKCGAHTQNKDSAYFCAAAQKLKIITGQCAAKLDLALLLAG